MADPPAPRARGILGWLQDQDLPNLLSLMAVCLARATNAGPRTWTTPALIVEAVPDRAGTRAAGQIASSKKEVTVADAEQLLAGTGWLLQSCAFWERVIPWTLPTPTA